MKGIIYSLFDGSGIAGLPWAEDNYQVYCFNSDDADHGDYSKVKVLHPNIKYINSWIDENFNPVKEGFEKPDLILAFPPCTDLAVSGAAHFKKKKDKDPFFQINAIRTAKIAAWLAEFVYDCPYMIENPISVLSSKWRKPDIIFHPYEYGGYLPVDDTHPDFPDYIKARDAYPKKTCLWIGNGFILPAKMPVEVLEGYSDQYHKLGGKSKKTKLIRSLTPRGMSKAIFLVNSQ